MCIIPWKSIYLSPDGRVSPCCAFYDGDYDQEPTPKLIDHPKLEEIRNQFLAGEIPKGCSDCFNREAMGLSSWRTEAAEVFKGMKISSEIDKVRIQHLDISFGNACNLKCRFCKPENSSAWISDMEKLAAQDPGFWRIGWRLGVHSNGELLDRLFENDLSELRYLEIKGGEPFIYKNHGLFLTKLKAACDLRNVRIHYSTNATAMQPEAAEFWRSFRSVGLTVSIDGTGEAYRYVRGGSLSLETDIHKNILAFDQHAVGAHAMMTFYFTVCAYNIFEIGRLVDWVKSLNLRVKYRFQFIVLTDPAHLRVKALPFSVRRRAAALLPDGSEYDHLRRTFLEENEDQAYLHQGFIKYTRDLDRVRGTDIRVSIPELAEGLEGYESISLTEAAPPA
jgi:MoaA/NifB/PqqE/SkfB family radical SAM enzyme